MGRPAYDVAKAKRLLKTWIAQRVPKAPHDAPITIPAACAFLNEQDLPTHRSTFIKYKLSELVTVGERLQRTEGGGDRTKAERAAYDQQLREMRAQLELAENRARALLAEIATMRFNARTANISERELMKPIPSARAHRDDTAPPRTEKIKHRDAESGRRR